MAFRANKRPRLNSVAVPIVGEFLLGMTVAMGGLWLAAQTSDAAAGSFGLSIQITESLFVLFRVLAIGVGVVTTQALGGKQPEVARRTALVGLGAGTWVGALAAACLLLGNNLILDVLNAPDEVLPIAAPYLQLLAPALVLEAYNLTMAAILRAHLHARESLHLRSPADWRAARDRCADPPSARLQRRPDAALSHAAIVRRDAVDRHHQCRERRTAECVRRSRGCVESRALAAALSRRVLA